MCDIVGPSRPTNISLIVHAEKITVSWSPITPYPGPTDYTVEFIDNQDGSTKSCFTLGNCHCWVMKLLHFHQSKGNRLN